MGRKVIVIGGGIAGLTAAHELALRDYEVTVLEKNPKYVGGKARSIDIEGTGKDGRLDLTGEHGFRFFPGFYNHTFDTMKAVPKLGGGTLHDNLVYTDRVLLGEKGDVPITTLVNFPKSFKEVKVLIKSLFGGATELTDNDIDMIGDKLWQLMTSSDERRRDEYEQISWWEFSEADKGSQAYRNYFVGGLTRSLVAAKPTEISAKTGGSILLQLIYLMLDPSKHADMVLNNPTNEAWLTPWKDWLIGMGVKFMEDVEVEAIVMTEKVPTVLYVETSAGLLTASHYVCATPVEVANRLLSKYKTMDGNLAGLSKLTKDTEWMNGIQYFLNEDIDIIKGHSIFVDSPWAITLISQLQFWEQDGFDISEYGNGNVKAILSVCVSDWETKGYNGKTAQESTVDEIKNEVWEQIKSSLLDGDKNPILNDDMVVFRYLDESIIRDEDGNVTQNLEPLLVNKVDTWKHRPEAKGESYNLYLASDYVKTNTDLATMESANEAAKRAVNALLKDDISNKPLCKIYELEEPTLFNLYKWFDKNRYKKGKKWSYNPNFFFRILEIGNILLFLCQQLFKRKKK